MESRTNSEKIKRLTKIFWIPVVVLITLISGFLINSLLKLMLLADIIYLIGVILGSFDLFKDTFISLLRKKFALDYIAILAIVVSVFSGQYLVAGVIALMLASGRTLEDYGMTQAKQSLSALAERIPNSVHLWEDGQIGKRVLLQNVSIHQQIVVRKGEVIPLDGILQSEQAIIDESSLTGEPYAVEKIKGDHIRSGTVNMGNIIILDVTAEDKNSTYSKIINMVKEAQDEKSPFIRLADRYSIVFALITLGITGIAIIITGNLSRVLSILVIATPCPLILATPIALMGGMNAAAKQKIIIKKIASIEALSKVNTLIFDKTGTITLGKPSVKNIDIKDQAYTEKKILAIASAIERSSLHPLAKAIVNLAAAQAIPVLPAKNIEEKIGAGISATVQNKRYTLAKLEGVQGMAIAMTAGNKQIAILEFEDKIKTDTKRTLDQLKQLGLSLLIFTGDKKAAAESVAKELGHDVVIKAECTPEDKKNGIKELKDQKKVTAMIGDGINDAPALAMADTGMVFSNEEHTASSEAADVVFLAGDLASVTHVIALSKRSIHIALQSIITGIGLSIIGMLFAAAGFIPPIIGAFAQEAIDVIVILNALRASRS